MKVLDVGLAGINEIKEHIFQAYKAIMLLEELITEVNETENKELSFKNEEE